MKLYRSAALPDHWIGEDAHGALVQWPAGDRGWLARTPYTGHRRGLEAVPAARARGTGWPGGGVGRRPRAGGGPGKLVAFRVTDEERSAWTAAAGYETLSDWARRELNAAAKRKR